jgi:membrane fusion protein (multidrug efflux system)
MDERNTAEGQKEQEGSADENNEEPSPSPKQKETDQGKGQKQEKEDESDSKPFRPSKKVIVIGAIIVVVLVVAAFLYWLHARNFVSTDDAYTTGHVHQISARVPGTVVELNVDDNQHVKAGDVLVRLDPRDYEVSLEKARAALGQAEAQKIRQDAVIAQTRAQGSAADAQYEKARLDYERITGLFTKDIKAVSKADVDAATASLVAARAQVEESRANLLAAQGEFTVDDASVKASEADVHDAELQLSYCNVLSPVDGKVSKRTVETGQRLQPGEALMAIVPDDVWILANLKETQLERVQIGQRVDIKIDTLPHYEFFGTVNSIQEGSGATFSLLPPDNATGNFTKIVQRVPVKIVFDDESIRDFRDKIVPGLSVEPTIDLLSPRNDKREKKRKETEEKQNREAEKRQ